MANHLRTEIRIKLLAHRHCCTETGRFIDIKVAQTLFTQNKIIFDRG